MTGIAKFYNKFLSFIELDPTRPDPTRGSTRPVCNSDVTVYVEQLLEATGFLTHDVYWNSEDRRMK